MNRNANKAVFVFILIFFCSVFAASGSNEEIARFVRRFETDWLTAILNKDLRWLERLGSTHSEVRLTPGSTEQREKLASGLLDPTIPDDARKVRITGTISFLTSDPGRNRSFQFLDTFNRHDGKWEVIASSFSPADAAANVSGDSKQQVEKEVRILDAEAAKAVLDKNEAAIARFFADDSVTNNPRNSLTHGSSGVIEAARAGLINYYSFERVIESVQVLGNTVVIMGNEKVVMKDPAGGLGETVKRRYTNVWMKTDKNWQIVARHANIIADR